MKISKNNLGLMLIKESAEERKYRLNNQKFIKTQVIDKNHSKFSRKFKHKNKTMEDKY